MAITPAQRAQIDARNAQIAAENAAQAKRRQAQNETFNNSRIPIYGVGKGMSVYYAPGQTPGPSRTTPNGEISGYWDKRTNRYVPENWTMPGPGSTIEEDGRTYYGGDPPDWMLSGYNSATGTIDPESKAKQLARMRPEGSAVGGGGQPPAGWNPPTTLRGGVPSQYQGRGPAWQTNPYANYGQSRGGTSNPGAGGGSPTDQVPALKRAWTNFNFQNPGAGGAVAGGGSGGGVATRPPAQNRALLQAMMNAWG